MESISLGVPVYHNDPAVPRRRQLRAWVCLRPWMSEMKRGGSSFHLPGDSRHSTFRVFLARGGLFDEGLVVRCRHAEIEHIAETAGVVGQERPGSNQSPGKTRER